MDKDLEAMRRQVEEKREQLNDRALELYEETGKLSDPVLCELSNAFTDLAYEYQNCLKQKDRKNQDENR